MLFGQKWSWKQKPLVQRIEKYIQYIHTVPYDGILQMLRSRVNMACNIRIVLMCVKNTYTRSVHSQDTPSFSSITSIGKFMTPSLAPWT